MGKSVDFGCVSSQLSIFKPVSLNSTKIIGHQEWLGPVTQLIVQVFVFCASSFLQAIVVPDYTDFNQSRALKSVDSRDST